MQAQTAADFASSVTTETGGLFVTVGIGQEIYGLPIEAIESIVRWEPLTRLPRQPRFMAGLCDLRGKPVPVLDLRKRLELPSEECGPNHRIVITFVEGRTVGLTVDAVREVVWIESSQVETMIPFITGDATAQSGACLRGVANLPQGFVILLDVAHLLSQSEHEKLAKLETRIAA